MKKNLSQTKRHFAAPSPFAAAGPIPVPAPLPPYPTQIQITATTTSSPLPPAASYLKLHIPSRELSQYAPAAACIPRLPSAAAAVEGGGLDAAEVALGESVALAADDVLVAVDGFGDAMCWMMVLVMLYLYGGWAAFGGVVAVMREERVLF